MWTNTWNIIKMYLLIRAHFVSFLFCIMQIKRSGKICLHINHKLTNMSDILTLIEKSRFCTLCIFVHFPIEFSATIVYYSSFWQQGSQSPQQGVCEFCLLVGESNFTCSIFSQEETLTKCLNKITKKKRKKDWQANNYSPVELQAT